MPKPTRKSLWRAREALQEDPYSGNNMERIVRAIEEGANRQLSLADRNRLQNEVKSVARAFKLATYQHKGPTPGQIRAALEDLYKAADELLRVVNALDDASILALLGQHGEFRKAYSKARAQNHEKAHVRALGIISDLSAEAKAAIKEVGKPHPSPDQNPLDRYIDWEWDPIYRDETPITKFVIWLAFIFNEITGAEPLCKHDRAKKNTYYGDFFLFVEACLAPLEVEPRKALGKTVQDALPKWRARRDARA